MSVRRNGRERPSPFSLLPAVVGLAVLAGTATAQVGYDPERSPFRDLRRGSAVSLNAGYFGGDAGGLGIGASGGPTATARFELSLGGPTVVALGATWAQLERDVLDPGEDSATRRTGPFGTDILMLDVGLQLRLTGQKSWRRIAPYLGAALGLAFEVSGPNDPGGYNFGTKLTVAPGAGVRFHPSQRLSVNTDFRLLFWRLSYPLTYQSAAPDGSRILEPSASTTDWTTHPWLTVGVAWTF